MNERIGAETQADYRELGMELRGESLGHVDAVVDVLQGVRERVVEGVEQAGADPAARLGLSPAC